MFCCSRKVLVACYKFTFCELRNQYTVNRSSNETVMSGCWDSDKGKSSYIHSSAQADVIDEKW